MFGIYTYIRRVFLPHKNHHEFLPSLLSSKMQPEDAPIANASEGVHVEDVLARRSGIGVIGKERRTACVITACPRSDGKGLSVAQQSICSDCWHTMSPVIKDWINYAQRVWSSENPTRTNVYLNAPCIHRQCPQRVHSIYPLTGVEPCAACSTTASSTATRALCSVCFQSSTHANMREDGRCSSCVSADRWETNLLSTEMQDRPRVCAQCNVDFFSTWDHQLAVNTCEHCSAQSATSILRRVCVICQTLTERDFHLNPSGLRRCAENYMLEKSSYACDECRSRMLQQFRREPTRSILEDVNQLIHDLKHPDRTGYVPVVGLLLRRCENCWTEGTTHRLCPCGTVAYCGVECQRLDWGFHRKTCSSRLTPKVKTSS